MYNLNSQNLDKYKWENRILIIETTDQNNEEYRDQIKEFENSKEELAERKLVIYEIIGSEYKMTDYSKKVNESEWKISEERYRNKMKNKTLFRVSLIGLDGGIKLEKEEVLKKQGLIDIIDSMPMRRRQIKSDNDRK